MSIIIEKTKNLLRKYTYVLIAFEFIGVPLLLLLSTFFSADSPDFGGWAFGFTLVLIMFLWLFLGVSWFITFTIDIIQTVKSRKNIKNFYLALSEKIALLILISLFCAAMTIFIYGPLSD